MDVSLNVSNQNNKNKKGFKRDIQTVSNSQAVNPSFNFSWNNGVDQTQPVGKVFARKRKANNTDGTQRKDKQFIKKIAKNKNNEQIPSKSETVEDQSLPAKKKVIVEEINEKEDDHDITKSGHIKRKQKKDKQLFKQLAKEGKQSEIKLSQNNQKEYSLFGERQKNVYVDSRQGKSVSEKVFTGAAFKDLDIHKYLVSNLDKIGFTELTNVQGKSIPVVMSGKNTLIRSQTGSGKTLAYAVPIIDALQGLEPRLKRTDGVQAIVVVPTRELALQTHELFSKINTFQCVIVGHLCGGENRKSEKDRIRKGINVLIGTPGRLLDHVLHTNALKIDKVRCLVLDEADRLLDMGFRKDIVGLVEALDKAKTYSTYDPMSMLKSKNTSSTSEEVQTETSDLPPLKNPDSSKRQTVLLSATLNKGVSELAEFTMKEHTYIDALDQTSNAILDSFVIPDTVKQEFMVTYVKHRLFTLSAVIVAKAKTNSKLLIFMASSQMVEYHHDLFTRCLAYMPVNRGKMKIGNVAVMEEDSDEEDEEEQVLDIPFFKLHGSMDQKVRKEVFTAFRDASKGVLLCTDVAARGLDIPLADCIVQYTGPQTDEDYLHRVGRTGRAGKTGTALIFLTHDEQEYVSHLREHRVFMKKRDPDEYLSHLCDLMEEPDHEKAATALQKRYESAVSKDKDLYKAACFAYSTWSRFYNSYPQKLRPLFDFKKVNSGHYVTSFALRDTPTSVARVVRGQVVNIEAPRLNKKLANHADNIELKRQPNKDIGNKKKRHRPISLTTSEFSSGLEPVKKKKKKAVE